MADAVVTLDVGGVVYRTGRATLTRYPDSMLAAMFSGRHHVTTDNQGRCFIDGDGSLFRYVLNFLRRSELVLPEDFKELDMLKKEAEFYQLQPLVDAIEIARQACRPGQHIKIESLALIFMSEHRWKLLGEKRTIDMMTGRINSSNFRMQRSTHGRDATDMVEAFVDYVHDVGRFHPSQSAKVQWGARLSKPDRAFVACCLYNVILDLGFTLKHSDFHKNVNSFLFERS